jgi:hypothetical protein
LAVDTAAPDTNPEIASLSTDCGFSRDNRCVGRDVDAAISVGEEIGAAISIGRQICSAASEHVVVEAYDGGAEISSAIIAPAAIVAVQNVRRHTASADAPGSSSSSKSSIRKDSTVKTGLFKFS